MSKEKLLPAIERALVRYEEIREQDNRIADLRSLLSQLTPREHEVFELLVRGKPHKQIAFALDVSERTIKAHRHNIMQKFHVQSLAELAVIAERLAIAAGTVCRLNEAIGSRLPRTFRRTSPMGRSPRRRCLSLI